MVKLISVIILGVIAALLSCTYKISEYLLPEKLDSLAYRYSFTKPADSFYRKMDSLFGNPAIQEVNGTYFLSYRPIKIKNEYAYYSINHTDSLTSDPTIGTSNFLFSAMLFKNDTVFLAPIHRKWDLLTLSPDSFRFVIPPALKRHDTVRVFDVTLSSQKELILTNFRKKSLPHQKLKGCLVIDLFEVWPDTTYKGKVWLHKRYGVVRWERTTDRIDERILD